jgi:hypothetical protein
MKMMNNLAFQKDVRDWIREQNEKEGIGDIRKPVDTGD